MSWTALIYVRLSRHPINFLPPRKCIRGGHIKFSFAEPDHSFLVHQH